MIVRVIESDNELQQAFNVRMEVFVLEQKVSEDIEIDELEEEATHFIGYEDMTPIAASRLRFVEEYGKLERICILKDYRGKSHGKELIEAMEATISAKGYKKAKLNAQTHAEGFYQKLGYTTVSGEFLDAGIPHVTMIKEL
ncbi:GNAT family N-acetyltransferase [Oceanobacillus arenosus]|uniref:GNAT family N-acetyltransferase n=1 Tax=Oceanobacillus arenosus TaxID=1229153 RepID=A0A3D8PQ91_9BACI|nr:GNAT family N-acetyltransferase [Oceanobacillus arenosus]RDW18290.1 GNAT family N-acetyltransferase [Oceanobacillus arenosus]